MRHADPQDLVVVDSCGWLEYIAGGENASFFEQALLNTQRLIVPSLCIFEVSKRLLITHGEAAAREVLDFMMKAKTVHLNSQQMFTAAQTSSQHGLAMADAIIWQTAHSYGAKLYTQDKGLKDMPNVLYKAKLPLSSSAY